MRTEKILGYDIHRKKVKNINLRINQNMEVYISAPLNLHSSYIDIFIRSKEDWIKKVLNRIEDVKSKQTQYEYKTGEIHKLIGREYSLIVKQGNIDRVNLSKDTGEIILVTKNESIENKKKIMDKWYYDCAKRIFPDVMEKWLKILGETIEHLSIKPMKTRWGSCNYNKRYINLNTELIKRTPFENQGKGFYNYVENYMPNYKEAEKLLNAKHYY